MKASLLLCAKQFYNNDTLEMNGTHCGIYNAIMYSNIGLILYTTPLHAFDKEYNGPTNCVLGLLQCIVDA